MKKEKLKSLSVKLLKIILGFYLLITVVTVILQITNLYFKEKTNLKNTLKASELAFISPLSNSLYEFNDEQVKTNLVGLLKAKEVIGVSIVLSNVELDHKLGTIENNLKEIVHFGEAKPKINLDKLKREGGLLIHSFPINHVSEFGEKSFLGTGNIFSSESFILDNMIVDVNLIILSALLQTIILCLLFIIVFKKFLVGPLGQLQDVLNNIDLKNITSEKIAIISSKDKNELHFFQETINEMKEKLFISRNELKSYSDCLEDMVSDRTEALKNILNNLGQAFLVFDKNGMVEKGWSSAAEVFFEKDLSDAFFPEVLNMDEKQTSSFKKWIDIVFQNRFPFKKIASLVPREFIGSNRYIDLEYRPIYRKENGKEVIFKIICIGSDKTEEKKVKKQFSEKKKEVNRWLKLLKNKNSFKDTYFELQSIFKNILKKISKGDYLSEKEEIRRALHTIKGSLSSYGFLELAEKVHQIETDFESILRNPKDNQKKIDEIKKNIETVQNNLIQYLTDNKEILGEIDSKEVTLSYPVETIFEVLSFVEEKLEGEDGMVKERITEILLKKTIHKIFVKYEEVLFDLAKKEGKTISFVIKESDIKIFHWCLRGLLTSYIHILSNMVIHGIEDEKTRKKVGKPKMGKIELSFSTDENFLRIKAQDDGKGIKIEELKNKLESQLEISRSKLDQLSSSEIYQFILKPGVSTSTEINEHAGRGVGMSAVKAEVDKLKGAIEIHSKDNVGTEIIIKVPLDQVNNINKLEDIIIEKDLKAA